LLRDRVQRFVPGNALESSLAFGADALLRIKQAVGRVLAIQIPRHLAAQESARDRMIGIAAQTGGASVVDIDQQRAGVWAIESTHRRRDFQTGGKEGAGGDGAQRK